MKYTNILLFTVVAGTLNAPVSARGYEYDPDTTADRIMEMIVDLGGHDTVGTNSGKTMRCSYGGTRKVTIVKRGSNTTYTGDYRNCRETGSTRDGIYEIFLTGDSIIKSSSRRSINGELFDASMQGSAKRVRKLIKAQADVNYTESIQNTDGGSIDEWTPLMSAVMAGNLETVKLLISNGAWVNYLNSMAVNAVWIAANTGQLEIVKYLAAHGAYINNRNNEDVTPLMAAAMNGHLDVVRFLIAAKAQLDLVHKGGDTALMFALAGKHTAIARLLVEAGADVNIRNSFGTAALHIAAAEGSLEGVTMLIDRSAAINVRSAGGKTALDVALDRGLTNIAEVLEKAAEKSGGSKQLK